MFSEEAMDKIVLYELKDEFKSENVKKEMLSLHSDPKVYLPFLAAFMTIPTTFVMFSPILFMLYQRSFILCQREKVAKKQIDKLSFIPDLNCLELQRGGYTFRPNFSEYYVRNLEQDDDEYISKIRIEDTKFKLNLSKGKFNTDSPDLLKKFLKEDLDLETIRQYLDEKEIKED